MAASSIYTYSPSLPAPWWCPALLLFLPGDLLLFQFCSLVMSFFFSFARWWCQLPQDGSCVPGDSGIRLLVPASRAQTMAANFHSGGSTLPPFQSPLWMADCFFSFLMISCVYRTKMTLENVASPSYNINIIPIILRGRVHVIKFHHIFMTRYFIIPSQQ